MVEASEAFEGEILLVRVPAWTDVSMIMAEVRICHVHRDGWSETRLGRFSTKMAVSTGYREALPVVNAAGCSASDIGQGDGPVWPPLRFCA